MDTKSLKHHKRPKKNKSRSKKGNNDVLVVPPDILKKLGISIGNSNSVVPISADLTQSTKTEKLEQVANNLISGNDKQSNESSFLETANLMKKSVFLSPTFVPTVANVIPGEVEISNNKNCADSEDLQNISLGTVKVNKTDTDTINANKSVLKDSEINGNCDLTINGAFTAISNINENLSQISTEHKEIILELTEVNSVNAGKITQVPFIDDLVEKRTLANNSCKSTKNKTKCNVTNKDTISRNNNDDIQSSVDDNKVLFEKFKVNNTINYLEDSDIQSTDTRDSHLSLNNVASENGIHFKQVTNIDIPLKSNDMQVKPVTSDLNETGIQIQQTKAEINLNSLEQSGHHTEPIKAEHDCNSLIGDQILNIPIEVDDSCNNLGKSHIQIETESNHTFINDYNIPIEEIRTENKSNLLQGNGNQVDQAVAKNNNIYSAELAIEPKQQNGVTIKNKFIEGNVNQVDQNTLKIQQADLPLKRNSIQFQDVDNVTISLDKNQMLTKQPGLQKNLIKRSQIQDKVNTYSSLEYSETDNDSISLQISTTQIEKEADCDNSDYEADNYLISTENYAIMAEPLQNLSPESDIIDLEESNITQDISEDYLDDLLSKADHTEITEKEVVNIDIMESSDNNNYQNIFDSRDVSLQSKTISDSKRSTTYTSLSNRDIHSSAMKLPTKINIISEEIIPASHLKDLSRSQSPIVRTLTPVPLNTVIASKKVTDNMRPRQKIARSKNISTAVQCSNESLDTEANVNKNRSPTESQCLINGITENKNDNYLSNTIKVDTIGEKEYNDEHKSSFKEFPCKYTPKIDLMENNCKQNTNIDGNENHLEMNNQFDKEINRYDNPNMDKETVKDNKRNVEKKKRKKNVADEKGDSELNVTGTEDRSFCDDQLNNILKSSKNNNDANSHLDKVKEIAEYIKKYAHIYKDTKRGINKDAVKKTDNKKETINSKSNSIKSKLCIQGVEKPGGTKASEEVSAEVKTVKTYSRVNKPSKPRLTENTSDKRKNTVNNVVDAFATDVSTVDIGTFCRNQYFCLCYDFGRLDIYDNAYEHIHFWLHNDNSDLESILSIYNDNDILQNDRTALDGEKIVKLLEDKTETNEICWNYFSNEYIDEFEEIATSSNKTETMDSTTNKQEESISTDNTLEINSVLKTAHKNDVDNENDISEREAVSMLEDYREDICSNNDQYVDFDEHLKGTGKITYEIISIVETEENQNPSDDIQAKESDSTATSTASDLNITESITLNSSLKSCNLPTPPQGHWQAILENEASQIAAGKSDKNLVKADNDKQGSIKTNLMPSPKEKENSVVLTTVNKENRKRSFPDTQSPGSANTSIDEGPPSKKNIKCGVCSKLLAENKWERHVSNKHSYIAWKAGSSLNFDDPDLIVNLQHRLQTVGALKCPVCYMQTKKFNKYMCHIKKCIDLDSTGLHSSRRVSTSKDIVICGVCKQTVQYLSWMDHIGREHNYIAWVEGQESVSMDDEDEVVKHLQNVIRVNGCLTCHKCGLVRKRAKLFLAHIETCDGSGNFIDDSTMCIDLSSTTQFDDNEPVCDKKAVTCGVCKLEVPLLEWTKHIGKEHNYLAWEEGNTPLDVDDEEAVWKHLQQFIRHKDGLMCYKCGLNRKRVKLYLSHIQTCDGKGCNLDDGAEDVTMEDGTDEKKFECGVCNAQVSVLQWNEHIGREHNYLAWKVGSTPLDVNDEDAVKEHLLDIIRNCEGLICYKCGLSRRRVKLYLSHVQNCDGSESRWDESTSSVNLNTTATPKVEITIDETNKLVTCGVCDEQVLSSKWIEHIGENHIYLAWKKDEKRLNLDNEDEVKEHLLVISRNNSGLKCNKCGVIKKYPKSFQHHVRECNGETLPLDDSKTKVEVENIFDVSGVKTETVMCGVCNNEIKKSEWFDHMGIVHDYVAWLAGKTPLNTTDQAVVQRHLIDVSKKIGGLKCNKCGLVRKYAKTYQHHVENCGSDVTATRITTAIATKDAVECAVCLQKVEPRDWRSHAMNKHYNVAWIVGGTPIEINNPYGVEPYIKEYQQKNNMKLVCKSCGASRVSAVGFYAHIITCGKTEEETEKYKSVCHLCNNKYLRIYKSQHMTMHREQEYAQERKILIAKEKALKREEYAGFKAEIIAGKRKAAEKAKTVIEKYTSNFDGGLHCHKCGFASEVESEMSNHVCVKCEGSDSDESVELDHMMDDDDEDSDIDSNISDEEQEALDREMTKSKKHGDSSASSKIQRLPYLIKNINSYMRKSAEEFIELNLTDKEIFPEWRTKEYEIISEAEMDKYMPRVLESCKMRLLETDDWMTYKRFEATKEKDIITLFTGACIQCARWVPPHVNEALGPVQEYLSVVTHLDSDIPRHLWHEKPTATPALVQIWDCGNLIAGIPKFVTGLALDCGVIWAIDWCPSGARDVLVKEEEEDLVTRRLGLLAVASATGSAFIFDVPNPATLKEKDLRFYKLKPLVELRLAMSTNRSVHQATSIKWSSQKEHTHIVVGYSDGTMAFYDLKNESPILKCIENGVTIFYPYYDERAQSMCIEDVDIFPSRSSGRDVGVVAAGSVGGAGVSARAGSRAASMALQAHAAAARVLFPPHWPAALLAGDDNLVSQAINELEWHGAGRRVGGMRACGGCAWCGRTAVASAPLVRVMRPHPAYSELHRQVIATVNMIPFGNKRKRKNDELSMIMEPLTYNDATAKYGLEFKQILAKDKLTQQKLSGMPREAYPERFPLADITSLVFCPSPKNHHKLAIATHAGFLFIINV